MFLILPWRDTESVKPCLSKEKVNEWCGICIGWQGNQGQVETWKSWEACEGGEGAGAASCTMQRHLSPSSRKFPLCWWEPHGGTSAAAALPLAFCCWQIVWHQQTLLVSRITSLLINSQEGPARLCPWWWWAWKSPMCNTNAELGVTHWDFSCRGGNCCVKSDLGKGFEEESNF